LKKPVNRQRPVSWQTLPVPRHSTSAKSGLDAAHQRAEVDLAGLVR
jgi:hypothetical protein